MYTKIKSKIKSACNFFILYVGAAIGLFIMGAIAKASFEYYLAKYEFFIDYHKNRNHQPNDR